MDKKKDHHGSFDVLVEYEKSQQDLADLVDEVNYQASKIAEYEHERNEMQQLLHLKDTQIAQYQEEERIRHERAQEEEEEKESGAIKYLKEMLHQQALAFQKEKEDLLQIHYKDPPSPPPPPHHHHHHHHHLDSNNNNNNDMMRHRIQVLEEHLAQSKTMIAALERTTQSASRERNAALADLEKTQTELGILQEQFITEQTQRNSFRAELVRYQRSSESATREARAAEKRHEALMNEMRDVMHERDQALKARDDALVDRDSIRSEWNTMKTLLKDISEERDAALFALQSAQRERDNLVQQLEGENRQRSSNFREVEILKQQLVAAGLERDSISRDRERAATRLEEALIDRRNALEARDYEIKHAEEYKARCDELSTLLSTRQRKVEHLENRLEELEQANDELKAQALQAEAKVRDASRQVQAAEDDRRNAFQDLEALQRQNSALGEELKSVIRLRDLLASASNNNNNNNNNNQERFLSGMETPGRINKPTIENESSFHDTLSAIEQVLMERQIIPVRTVTFTGPSSSSLLARLGRILQALQKLPHAQQLHFPHNSSISSPSIHRNLQLLREENENLTREIEELRKKTNPEVQIRSYQAQEILKENESLRTENTRLKDQILNEQRKLRETLILLRGKEEIIQQLTQKARTTTSTLLTHGTHVSQEREQQHRSSPMKHAIAKELEEVCEVLETLEKEFTPMMTRKR